LFSTFPCLSVPVETQSVAGDIFVVTGIFVTQPGSLLSAAKSAAECVVADKINIITTGNGKNHVEKAQGETLVQQRGLLKKQLQLINKYC